MVVILSLYIYITSLLRYYIDSMRFYKVQYEVDGLSASIGYLRKVRHKKITSVDVERVEVTSIRGLDSL